MDALVSGGGRASGGGARCTIKQRAALDSVQRRMRGGPLSGSVPAWPEGSSDATGGADRRRRLRVLIVVEATFAGVGRHVVDLCSGLLARGHEIHLAYSSVRMEERFRQGIDALVGLRAHRLDMVRGPSPNDARAILALRRYIRKNGPFDIVHGHSSKGGAIARLAATGAGARRVYTAHALRTMDPDLGPSERILYTGIERLLGGYLTDAFIGVAREEADEARRLGVAPERAHVIANGVILPVLPERRVVRSRYGLGDPQVCLMWVGRLSPQKAPERFIRLFGHLAGEMLELQALMIGTGPLEAHLRTLIQDLGLAGRLRQVRDQHALQAMPAADIYVMTSRYEGLPYVLLEAQSIGLPVVAFDVGGLGEAIEKGTTGFAIPQNNEAGFLDALRRLIGDPALRDTMGRAAARRAMRFGLETMVDRVEALYQILSRELIARTERAW